MNLRRGAMIAGVALLAAGCATRPVPTPRPSPAAAAGAKAPPASVPRVPAVPPAAVTPPASAAQPAAPMRPPAPARKFPPAKPLPPGVAALLKKADKELAAGRLPAAAAALERGQRLAPRSPEIWQRIASVKLKQQEWDQAIQAATRSNMLAPGDERLQARNWDIIAQARTASGDAAGAQVARAKAIELQNNSK